MTYLLPGILLITVASGISYTAFRLFLDVRSGIFERFQSMPIARTSVLWAHVLTSLVANLISLVVVVLVALLMGFRSGAGALACLAVAGILVLFTQALTWIAVIPGLTAKSTDGVSAFLPAHLPAVHQLGIRTHPHHARPGAGLRRAPAGDVHRQRDPRPAHTAAGRHWHLDRPCVVCRHPPRRVHLRHGDLPSQHLVVSVGCASQGRRCAWRWSRTGSSSWPCPANGPSAPPAPPVTRAPVRSQIVQSTAPEPVLRRGPVTTVQSYVCLVENDRLVAPFLDDAGRLRAVPRAACGPPRRP